MVKMTPVVDGHYPQGEPVEGNRANDAHYRFDEQGFSKASSAAVLLARQQMKDRIRTINQDIIATMKPSGFSRSVDGVDDAPDDAIKL